MMNRALAELVKNPPKACFMHDWWVALCASCLGTIFYVPEPLLKYRQHEHNVLGARNTGSVEDLKERIQRQKQVEENYRRMFQQAAAFGKEFGRRLNVSQRRTLHEFLILPGKMIPGRIRSIVNYRFKKSSWLQTLAQCVTMPKEY